MSTVGQREKRTQKRVVTLFREQLGYDYLGDWTDREGNANIDRALLQPWLTLDMLRDPHGSVPGNPLLAEPLYLTQYIERMGTGTGDMIRRCREAGLPEPEFSMSDGFVITIRRTVQQRIGEASGRPESQPESQPESLERRVLGLLADGPLSKSELSSRLGQKEVSGHLNQVIRVLLADQTVEYTRPEKPTSRLQKYRLTDKGAALLAGVRRKDEQV
ncbi:MAG: Fic family protein [Pseudomonadota bacterium]|jgi:predicted HTH transcriptional regulator